MTSEIIVYGYIQVPYPYVKSFKETVASIKGKNNFKDFPDFISEMNECRGNALYSFGYSYTYEENFDDFLMKKFISFLKKVNFLTASLHFNLDEKENKFFQFFSDGNEFIGYQHKVHLSKDHIDII
jgi:hypothetical protein